MKRVVVVGGAGYIGGAVVDLLSSASYAVTVYDNLLYEETYRKEVPFVCGDIRDYHRLQQVLEYADAVVWLAALVGDPACQRYPELSIELNRVPLKWLAETFHGRIIFTSTCSVYGHAEGECIEETPPNPLSVYAETKLAAEGHLEKANAIIFRLGTLFGVGDLFARIRLDLVVNALTVKAYQDSVIPIYGGEQFRPLLHVKDVAQAIAEALECSDTGVFNLHRQNVRMKDLGAQIRNHYPHADVLIHPAELGDKRNYAVSSEKAQKELGFLPSYSIDFGIEQVQELLVSSRLKDTNNPRFCNGKFLPMQAVKALEAFHA